MLSIIKNVFGSVGAKSKIVKYYQSILELFLPAEPTSTPCLNLYPTTYSLIKCLNLDYDDKECLYIARTIYRYRGNKKSVDELARFLNIKITLQNYPSADLSASVRIIVTADAYLDDTVLFISLLKEQVSDLLFISNADYAVELQIIRLLNLIDSYELQSTLLNSHNYVGGRDDVSKNSTIFKYRITR